MSSSPTETGSQLAQVTMPQMGVSVAEGTIVEWRKRPGDWVEADEDDLRRHHRQDRRRDPVAGRRPPRAHPGRAGRHGRGRNAARRDRRRGRPGRGAPRRAQRQTAARKVSSPRPPQPEPAAEDGDRSGFYSPVVRRIADKHGVDLEPGRGHRDRRARAQEGRARTHRGSRRAAEARAAAAHRVALSTEEPEPARASRTRRRTAALAPRRSTSCRAAASRCPRCARRSPGTWSDSRRTAAHCTTIVEVDISRRRRAARRAERERCARRGVNLTYLAFVARGDGRGAAEASRS